MRKVLLSLMVIPAALVLQGCTDEQVAASAGFVGGVIVGSALDDHHDHSYRRCTTYRNYRGNWVRQCRGVGGWGYGYDHGYFDGFGGYSINSVNARAATVSPRADKFAKRYQTSLDAAQKVVSAFDRSSNGDLSGFKRIGLDKTELTAIYEGRLPSHGAMDKLSSTLDLDPRQAEKVMKSIVATVQHQKRIHGR